MFWHNHGCKGSQFYPLNERTRYHMTFRHSLLGGLALLGAAVFGTSHEMNARTQIDPTLEVIQQWVETERMIARDAAAWEADRASTENLLSVFAQELQMLQERIEAARADTSAAELARAELDARDAILRELETAVMRQIVAAEIELLKLISRLPPPLRAEMRPLINALPENPATATGAMAQRITPIVASLTAIQRFNNSVTIVEEFREFEEGTPVQIEAIYFGLAAAYYVDRANVHAGKAVIGPNGWEWRDDASFAMAVRSFIDIHRATRQAEYVFLPVTIQD